MKKIGIATFALLFWLPRLASAGCYSVEKSMCVMLNDQLAILEAGECGTYECAHSDSASFEFVYKGKSHYLQLVKDGIAFEKPLLDGEQVTFDVAIVEHSPDKYTDEDDIFIIRRPAGGAWIIHRHVGPQHD